MALLRQDTGTTLSMAEQAIGQVGSKVESLGSHMDQLSAEQHEVYKQVQRADLGIATIMEGQEELVALAEEFE